MKIRGGIIDCIYNKSLWTKMHAPRDCQFKSNIYWKRFWRRPHLLAVMSLLNGQPHDSHRQIEAIPFIEPARYMRHMLAHSARAIYMIIDRPDWMRGILCRGAELFVKLVK